MTEPGDNDLESVEVKKEGRSLLPIVSVFVVVAAAACVILFTYRKEIREEPSSPALTEEKLPPSTNILPGLPSIVGEAETLAEPAEEPRPPLVLPPLEQSDPFLRQIVEEIGEGRLPSSWLEAQDLVRLFVVVVDNIAEGSTPRVHLPFIKIKKEFTVLERGERILLDPGSYHRYDDLTGLITSLNARLCARTYSDLRALFQEAYIDIGYPDRPFDGTLERALWILLKVPLIEGEIFLLKGDKGYHFEDLALENLTPAEKHLLRMGPGNAGKIQAFLGDFGKALGFAL